MDLKLLKEYLKSYGLIISISDTELESLYNLEIKILEGESGVSLSEKTHKITDIDNKKFNQVNYLLPDYPVKQLISIKIDNQSLGSEDYLLDSGNGIIHWRRVLSGNVLEIIYTSILDESLMKLCESIIYDRILYNLGDKSDMISSIKEGDLSLTYNNTNSTSLRLKSNYDLLINQLNNGRIRLV